MDKNFTEQDIRALIRDEVLKMLGVNQTQDIEYLPTEEAYRKLGYASPAQLREAINNGTLRLSYEVQDRRSPSSSYPRYYFSIPACIKRLNTPPEKRGA